MKKILRITILSVCIFILSGNIVSFAESENIQICINGKSLNTSIKPIIENGVTLVPMRDIFQELGIKINWDEKTRTVIGEGNGTVIKLTIGNNKAYVNGQEKQLDIPSKVIKGSTVVPLRFVSESIGCDVDWDGKERKIVITKQHGNNEGDISLQSTNIKAISSKLHTVKGSGKYSGYQRLRGYPNEDKFAVYFQGGINGSIVSYNATYEDLRKIDLNEIVEWKYEGKTYKNSRKVLYSLFSDTSQISGSLGIKGNVISTEWLIQTFGDVYMDWVQGIAYSEDAEQLVQAYFDQLINKESFKENEEEIIEYKNIQESIDYEKENEDLMKIIEEMLEQETSIYKDYD